MAKHTRALTILHSNDMHGDFLAEQVDENLVGGVAMLSGYIGKVREEEKNVIYAIAGDMFSGSVIDSEYRGVSTIDIMNALAPDVATIGNHEMDYGIAHMLFLEKCAQFPIINANLYIKSNNVRLFDPCRIIEIDGMKVLFIGILNEDVMAAAKDDEIKSLIDTADAVSEIGRICNAYNAENVDLTVLLTHIGFEEDKKLAAMLDPSWGIDMIIGGHSHTLLDEPAVVNGIPIVQAHTGTDAIGRLDIEIDVDNNRIDSYTWQFVPISSETLKPDKKIEKLIAEYKSRVDLKYNRVLSRFSTKLTHPKRCMETSLGNLFAEIIRDSLGIDMMLVGSGSIRCEELGPIVTYGDLVSAFPYDDAVYELRVTGAQFKQMVTYMNRDEAFVEHTEYYQFSSGVKMTYSRSRHELLECRLNGEDIRDDGLYTIGMQAYHFNNFTHIFNLPRETVDANKTPRMISTSCLQILEEYLTSHPHLRSEVEGRNAVID